jgi:L-seryl-tRNA(Ser) seleniumtransferase
MLATDANPLAIAQRLREHEPPLIGRIHDGRLLLDPRTLRDDELPLAGAAAAMAISR